MTAPLLKRLDPEAVTRADRVPVDPETLKQAAEIVDDVRIRGVEAIRAHAVRLKDLAPDEPLIRTKAELQSALDELPASQRTLLERTADRIRRFAQAQRNCLTELEFPIPGGSAGHRVTPVERAGCYGPGGRFPLPSSILMTAVTAKAAGVPSVWTASPRPTRVTLAAAALAGADGLLAVGGAQAVAALAFGADAVPPCDVVVGPGNRFVTAAKQLLAGQVGIDMLAGPSELLALADDSSDPSLIAADLLAQAEHDPDAVPILVSLDEALLTRVDEELETQLQDLPTAETARAALRNGFALYAPDPDAAVNICNRLAPEHLEVLTKNPDGVARRLAHWGALFIGPASAEVLADYGAGPNHVLPTGGTARFHGGLSVLTFLRVATWLRIDSPSEAAELASDAAELARLEGLEAHARAAEKRFRSRKAQ